MAIKTKAVGARKRWVKALTEDLKIDQKSTVDADKKSVVMNGLAYHHLVMSCTDKAFFYVQAAQDSKVNRDARKAWKELCQRYEDVLENDLIALTTEFNACRMKNANDDPTLWYAKLDHIHHNAKGWGTSQVRCRNDCANHDADTQRVRSCHPGDTHYACSKLKA